MTWSPLDAQLDEAKIATGQVRSIKEFADSDWSHTWNAVRTVSDRSGGEIKIPGRPWHFADPVAADEGQLAARQGEHNAGTQRARVQHLRDRCIRSLRCAGPAGQERCPQLALRSSLGG